MKRLLVTLFVLFASASVAFSQEHSRKDNPPPSAVWINYTSAEGRYSVSLPNQPKISSQEAQNSEGLKFTQHLASAYSEGTMCLIGYFDIGDTVVYSLEKGRDGMVSTVKGTLVSEQPVTLNGHPGIEIKIGWKNSGADYLTQARIYAVNKRVYIVQFLTLGPDTPQSQVASARRYFDSFSVTVP
jgi:hypothetical protein